MELYYNPEIRILTIQRRILQAWHEDQPKMFFWRLYWNSEPGAAIHYEKQVIALTPDRIILVPPNTAINQRLRYAPATHFYVHFLTNPPFDRLHSKVYVFDTDAFMLKAIKALSADKKYRMLNDISLSMAVRGLIHSLLSTIPDADLQPLRISPRMAENMSFIEAHIYHSISNSEIARHMGSSVNTMLRQYHHGLGMTPQAYLRQKRIEKACALLHDPESSIKQIAEETGFCDRYHFSRAFKQLQGVTPFQYRRRFG